MSFFVLTERRAAAAACDSSSGLRSPKRVRVPRQRIADIRWRTSRDGSNLPRARRTMRSSLPAAIPPVETELASVTPFSPHRERRVA